MKRHVTTAKIGRVGLPSPMVAESAWGDWSVGKLRMRRGADFKLEQGRFGIGRDQLSIMT